MLFVKQSTAVIIKMGPFVDDADGKTAETALSIAQADIQLSKNGGAFAQTSATTPTTTHDADGWYPIPLTTTDTGTLGTLTVQVAMTGALPVWRDLMVLSAKVYDSLVGGTDNLEVDAIQWLGTAILTPGVAGTPDVNAKLIGATSQTGRDLGASVLLAADQAVNVTKVGGTVQTARDLGAQLDVAVSTRLAPTVAARTLDVSAGGEAGIDWANVGSPTTAVGLSGTTISTSQQIASVSGAAGSVTGAVGSVTGNVGGNVTGSIGSLAAQAKTDVTGSVPTVAQIADGVWDEAISGHLGAGTTGAALNAAGSAGDPWTTPLPGAYGAGTAGKIMGDNLNATVSSRSTYAGGAVASVTADVGITQAGADKVWGSAARALTDKAGFTLSAAYDAAKTAATQTSVDAISTILSGITSLAKWLRGLFRKDAMDATAKTEVNSGGGTYDEATDSNEAIRDRGDAAWVTATGFALASVCTEARLAELDGVNLPAAADTAASEAAAAHTRADLLATPADVNAQVLDVLNVDTFAEPSAVPAASASMVSMVHWVFTLARNKGTQTNTTQSLRNDADIGNIATAAVSDDGTTFTRGKWT